MPPENLAHRLTARVVVGLSAGLAIAAIDNIVLGGEVSPIVIVALLIAATAFAGATWRSRAWVTAFCTWVCVPAAHLVKHLLGLPDTLQPNTYASILKLAAFSLVVAAVGTASGALLRGLVSTAADRDRGTR
jgi:hypothetical protein